MVKKWETGGLWVVIRNGRRSHTAHTGYPPPGQLVVFADWPRIRSN